jgi:hypothetical protein
VTCDYSQPWYHGSPEELDALQNGSWVTQFKEVAKAFSHKPSLMSFQDDECRVVKHNGSLPGHLYVICEEIGPEDVSYLPDTAGTHWQTQRDLQVKLVEELPVNDPPLLTEEEIAGLRKAIPEGTTGMLCDPD